MEQTEVNGPQSAFRGGASLVDNLGFSIDRVPGFAGVLDFFCAASSLTLEPLLGFRIRASADVPSVGGSFETLSAYQGKNGAVLHCVELDARVLLLFEDDGIETILGAILNAAAVSPDDDSRSRPAATLTKVETNLIREAAIALGSAFETAFRQTAHARFVLESFAPIKGVDALGRRDMQVVRTVLSIATMTGNGHVILILPQSLLQALRNELSEKPGEVAATDPRWARQIEEGVTRANLQVSAVLEELELTLADVASFSVGQTIELRNVGNGRVQLQSAGRAIFWGRVDEAEGRYRVNVEEPVVETGQFGV